MSIFATLRAVCVHVVLLNLAGFGSALAAESSPFSTRPAVGSDVKWRVGYYEGGPYTDYQKNLRATVRGLMALGWIEPAELPERTGEETGSLWAWLGTQAKSKHLVFVQDAHYSAEWGEEERKKTVERLLARLNEKKDIDLLIAMGTWAGKDMATGNHTTPTLVFSSSDPVASGIVKSIDDSGLPNLHATMDPFAYERQVRVFHEIINFKVLGMAYEDTVDGRSYAAVDRVLKVAAERGFKVEHCFTLSDVGDVKKEAETVKNCFIELAEKVDAIYVTQQGGVRPETISDLVEIANERKIPTFSQAGSEEVKYGFLASISNGAGRYMGEFQASVIGQVANGAKLRELKQTFETPPKIAINLKTAEIIGFDPPMVLLGAADEIFDEIAKPQ